ncbi:endonuclease III [Roseibium salinum]|uniref:Endonuclease III n=1 Tax=Roseibium salinum TaxID=1604349 RepID=A0ABT3R6X6_9HYPH|nr:endonuclease III [Roseibium sp. DSM 29163]MCX2724805.1 endonuclease III [Roseibium sp. DSM 29163]
MTQAKSSPSSAATGRSAKSAPNRKKTPSVDNPGRVLKRSRYSKAEIYEIFQRFHADNPEPKGELNYVNAFTLLVAVVLSAQATDVGVNRATRHLFEIADTPEKMVALGEDRLREEIRTIGLYKNKAKNVILLSQQLIRDHGGDVPENREALENLAGVGRKTANVVLNIYFGHPTIAVDTHLFRLGNRLGLAPGKTPLDVEKAMEKTVPKEFALHAHHWLILHGRYICKARKPECRRCLIYDLCKSPEKEKFDAVPEIALRTRALVDKESAA